MKLFQSTCHEAGVINGVQFLEGSPPAINLVQGSFKVIHFGGNKPVIVRLYIG